MNARVVLLVWAIAACDSRRLSYADNVDLDAMRASFGCASSPAGDRAQACRMIEDFASASAFTDAPKKSLETWFGRKVCLDALDRKDIILFGQVHLKPGVGTATWPDDVSTDSSRDVAYAAEFVNASVGAIAPTSLYAEYDKAIDAASKGATPDFSNLGPFEASRMTSFWESVKRPPSASKTWARLVRSDGKSVLGGPSASKDGVATYFIRAQGNRMLLVYASKAIPCVAELWKIHAE